MARTKKPTLGNVEYISEPELKVVSTDISTIDLDFGRADLNQLRDKLNEVILKGNK